MSITIRLLGRFHVVVDGAPVGDPAWSRRHAAALVKLLALTEGRRLHREQVMELLWPELGPADAAPRLHKAAHYARRAIGRDEAVVLRGEIVSLLPDADVAVDVAQFLSAGKEALSTGGGAAAEAALAHHTGDLLPDDPYDAWLQPFRAEVAGLHLRLARLAQRWADVVAADPLDEDAHLHLARQHLAASDHRAAYLQLERLERAVRHELGTAPGPQVERLREEIGERAKLPTAPASAQPPRTRLVGRRDVGDRLRVAIEQAAQGHGSTVVISGPPGVGKTSVLRLAEAFAAKRGWRIGVGSASSVDAPWPYAPVLEALDDLCRRHPALLDGLGDTYRVEIDRALSGREMTWSGESSHQRLFVAVAELLRLAATGHGVLLAVDDMHDADDASVRLLHYLARCATALPVVIVLTHRPVLRESTRAALHGLVVRGAGQRLPLEPLTAEHTTRLLHQRHPEFDPAMVERICALSAGLPYAALELARNGGEATATVLAGLPPDTLRLLHRLALLGLTFGTDEVLALSDADEDRTYHALEVSVEAMVLEAAPTGWRFRHALVRDALLDQLTSTTRRRLAREVAQRASDVTNSPIRQAKLYLDADMASAAVPYVVRTVETVGALGAYRDALELIDAVLPHADGSARARLVARRGDVLLALGDPDAVACYEQAAGLTTGIDRRLVLARLARAAALTGDIETAATALEGLELEGDAADPSILLARGNVAYFSGDIDAAWDVATRARDLLHSADDPWHVVDLVSLQGMIAHQRGEWFQRFRHELHRTQGRERLVSVLFDAHLCVAEYLLYGPMRYADIIRDAEELRRQAEQAGALRAVAFAGALIGEAALLAGDLDLAEKQLRDAADLHRDVDASAGEAHCLQRLAEVLLHRGDREGAHMLLQRALPLARWSVIALHLLQRIYGTMIRAAGDPLVARALVDQAQATLGETDTCAFCSIMLDVPAVIACAESGDMDQARRHLAAAEKSAAMWSGGAWEAAVTEAKAHIALAEGDRRLGEALLDEAATCFAVAGQPLDADRCRRAAAMRPVAGR